MTQPFEFTFGRDLFNAYQKEKQLEEESRQFNENSNFQQRRLSMLDMINQRQWEAEYNQRQQYQDAQIANMRADNERLSKEKPVDDLYEPLGTVDVDGKPMIKQRNKQTGGIEYSPAWREPDKPRESDPLVEERRRQLIEEAEQKKQANLEKSITDTDLWIAKTKSGLQTVGGKTKRSGYIEIGAGNKPVLLEKNEWRAKARGSVNATVSKLGMQSDITSLWVGAKKAAKDKGVDFDSLSPEYKRNFLKSIISDPETKATETQKKVLYQYIEIYTR